MPAAEPGREVDDWGRSQRVFDLVEPLLDFYYRYWFRVEVEGIENVPAEGGALLVSNHSGALPPDAPMIMQAIRHEHPRPRPLYMLGEHWFKGYPGVGMLANKIGLVAAHPANAQRLLRDEGRLVLVFPEGQKGSRKLYWQRYRLRRFGRGGFVRTAMRAGVPIVPVAVMGAEEAMPIFAHVPLLQRLTGLIYFPINHAFPHFGLAAGADVPAGEVQDPLPRAGRPVAATAPRTPTTSRWCRRSPSASGADPGGAGRPGTGAQVGLVRLGLPLAVGTRVARPAIAAGDLPQRWSRAVATRTSRTGRAPPVPVELTGVIQEDKVTVSPAKIGAGPVVITISNQTDGRHTITLEGESITGASGRSSRSTPPRSSRRWSRAATRCAPAPRRRCRKEIAAGRARDRQGAQELEQRPAAALS